MTENDKGAGDQIYFKFVNNTFVATTVSKNGQKWNLILHHQPCSSPQPSFLKEQKPQVHSDLLERNNINLLVVFLFDFSDSDSTFVGYTRVITYQRKFTKGV